MAQLCMEGMPWHWFKMLKEEDPNLNWEKFKRSFFDRYGGQQTGNLFLQLKMIRQEATLDEFVEEFEMLASQIPGIIDEQYLGLRIERGNTDGGPNTRTSNPIQSNFNGSECGEEAGSGKGSQRRFWG